MDPNQYPQQAPPQNQFDYILNSTPQGRKGGFIGGGNQKQKILLSVIFVLVVLVIIVVGFSVFKSLTKKDYSAYKTAIEQQTEIIRIADQGVAKARTQSVKNYASTIRSVTTSEKADTASFLKSSKIKVDEKALAAKKDANTDKQLTTAEQANQYDEKLVAILNGLVAEYQKGLKTFPTATTKSEKALVAKLLYDAKILVNVQK
jgi:hypothetical protein